MIKKDRLYVMESAEIYGNVRVGENSSIWSKVVIRGDNASVRIGKNTNIQDLCVIHAERKIPMEIGDNVTIGHRAVVHCRRVGSNCIVGMGAILLDNVVVGEYSIIGAGAVILENSVIPPRSIVTGVPGRVVRETDEKDIKRISSAALDYLRLAEAYCQQKCQRIHYS